MKHTVESIKHLLATNDKAVGRALIVLRNRQTVDERSSETTRHLNGRGFRPCHARMGTSMANFFESRGYLTAKQVAYWRVAMADGNSRIEIYARQLLEEAEVKAKAAAKVQQDAIDPDTMNKMQWDAMRAEREMQSMEAEWDRAQTVRDEMNKWAAREYMERAA